MASVNAMETSMHLKVLHEFRLFLRLELNDGNARAGWKYNVFQVFFYYRFYGRQRLN
jgi:hypothetical protein